VLAILSVLQNVVQVASQHATTLQFGIGNAASTVQAAVQSVIG